MGGKKRQALDDVQLHEQFRLLERRVDNIDDTYALVGSSVFDALLRFSPTLSRKDHEQYCFQQMKALYKHFDQMQQYLDAMKPFNVIMLYEHDALRGLDNLRIVRDDGVGIDDGYLRSAPPGSLLENILRNTGILDKKNKMTIIRDGGSRLYHNVMERGACLGNRNIMLKDYSDIEAAFR